MIWDELQTYITRKELSNKAINEIVEKLGSGQYASNEEVDSLVKVLLKLKPDVAYGFLISKTTSVSKELIEKILEKICVKNPAKSSHIYVIVIALAKAGYSDYANTLLLNFVKSNVTGKLNKQLFDGFRRAVKYGSDSFLFSKMEGWDTRSLNLYGRLLLESMEYLNDTDFTVGVKRFIESNEIDVRMPETKQGETKDSDSTLPKLKKSQASANDLQNIELNELLKLLERKVATVNDESRLKAEEIEKLRAENIGLKALNADLTATTEKLINQLNETSQKAFDLEQEVRALTKELEGANESLEKYKSKLNNVESAFGQAGQTEMDALKGNIRKRLSSEYEKYMEIKDKKPDLGYYEILLAVLEDVFRALKKNGITF